MIKKLIKVLSIILLIVILFIFYMSFIGVKTVKFNEEITNKILEINKKIIIDLKEVKFLFNPYNFTVIISTKNPTILLEGSKLEIRNIKTNISLKSLILDEFSMKELQIATKSIKLNDIILLARSFKNSTELFLLDKIIKDGFLTANIELKFGDEGKIKKDFQINGFVKNIKINFLNQFKADSLDFKFNINKNKYTLTEVKTDINNIGLSSPLIEIDEKKDVFLISGKILTKEKDFSIQQLSSLFDNLFKNIDVKKIRFSSVNNVSFNINKKLKLNDLNIESKINLDQLVVNSNRFKNLKSYLPNLNEEIFFENHKVNIKYNKKKLEIKGNGEIKITKKPDAITYQILKKNDEIIFDTKINLTNNKLLIDFLDFEKKENSDASILIKGDIKNNNKVKLNLISLIEKNNKIFLKNLNLNRHYKIISIDSFNFEYLNNRKIQNKLYLKKKGSNYTIEGESFDATKLINIIMDNDDETSTIFSNFNSKINIKINKTYIDEFNFINDLTGLINFNKNEINDLSLKSIFPNNKRIILLITTNDQQEKTTKLFTGYPKPLIKRYDFIKGFEEGRLDYYSIKKDGTSKSSLVIDDFKIKEVPVFAKLLSLASLQGIADLLTGEGIRFNDFEMKFSSKKGLTTIEELYAIGPAVSILMDGYIESKKTVSLRGTLVPATTINRSIASIPLLGNILIGKKTGEGVFGVSFKVKGTPKDLKTTVNPIKTLTPRFITRTLEKIKKN
jgi:hypothetical protein